MYSAVSRGVLRVNEDGSHSCHGKWAMTREQFTNGQTSNFNFRLESQHNHIERMISNILNPYLEYLKSNQLLQTYGNATLTSYSIIRAIEIYRKNNAGNIKHVVLTTFYAVRQLIEIRTAFQQSLQDLKTKLRRLKQGPNRGILCTIVKSKEFDELLQKVMEVTGGGVAVGSNGTRSFPLDSESYTGSFQLKKSTIVDTQLVIKFRKNTAGTYNVHGTGVNEIGVFGLTGTLIASGGETGGQVELYRIYKPKLLAPQAPDAVGGLSNPPADTIIRKRSSTPSAGASRSSSNEHVVCHKRPKIGGDDSSARSAVALDGCHQQQDTTTTTNNNNNNETTTPMPTTTDISLALCAIDYYGTRDKVTWDEVMQALEDLCNWRKNCNFDDADSVNTSKLTDVFIERCAGVPRILDFVTKNRNDIKLLLSSVKVLQSFLCYGKIGEHLLSTIEVAKKVVKYDGIKLLISITLDMFIGELNRSQLKALHSIWVVFGTLIHGINQNNMVDMDKVIPIIDCGISTLDVINKISDAEDVVVKIKSSVILSFCRIMDNAEMIDEEDFHRKNIFHTCVQAMKNSNNDDNDERSWKHNADTRGKTTHFFHQCCIHNRTLLSKEADYQVIIPFLIQFIKVDFNSYWVESAFGVLERACTIIGKKKVADNDGIFGVLAFIADNKTIRLDTKIRAKELMKRLL